MVVLALTIFALLPAILIAPPEFMFSTLEPSPLIFSSAVPNFIFLFAPNIISSLNVAAPAPDISKVNAFMNDPPSLPLNTISPSDTLDITLKSLPFLARAPNCVPSSFKLIELPPASKLILPALSNVIVEPSISSITGVVSVLLVKVCDPVSVATVESIASVTVVPVALESNPVPPATVNVSVPRATSIVPESVVKSKSCAVFCESTYALIDC